jgi:hypothetical protein
MFRLGQCLEVGFVLQIIHIHAPVYVVRGSRIFDFVHFLPVSWTQRSFL